MRILRCLVMGLREANSSIIMSTMEVKYIVALNVAKEALWLGRLAVTPVVCKDSQGAVSLARNPIHQNTSKNIELRYHFFQDCIAQKKPSLKKISIVDNVADAITEYLSTYQFQSNTNRL